MAPTKIKLEVYREEDWEQNDGMLKWGSILLLGSTAAFVLGVWAIAVAPFMDPTGISVLDAITNDTYYKYLGIFLVPVTLYAVIVNWWGLKVFRHS